MRILYSCLLCFHKRFGLCMSDYVHEKCLLLSLYYQQLAGTVMYNDDIASVPLRSL